MELDSRSQNFFSLPIVQIHKHGNAMNLKSIIIKQEWNTCDVTKVLVSLLNFLSHCELRPTLGTHVYLAMRVL